MSWLKIDDGIMDHPKVEAAIDEAGPWVVAVYLRSMCHAAKGLTDGKISRRAAKRLLADVDESDAVLGALVANGLWDDLGGNYQVHDYLDYNPTREKVQAEREAARLRKDASRKRSRDRSRRDTDRDNRCDGQRESQPESHPPRPVPSRPLSRPDLSSAAAADLGTSEDGPPPVPEQQQQQPGKRARPTPAQEPDRPPRYAERRAATERCVELWAQLIPGDTRGAVEVDVDVAVAEHGEAAVIDAIETVARYRHDQARTTKSLRRLLEDRARDREREKHQALHPPADDPKPSPPRRTEGWERILEAVRGQLNSQVLETYFEPLSSREEPGQLVLEAPTEFLAGWVREQYTEFLTSEARTVLGEAVTVTVEVGA